MRLKLAAPVPPRRPQGVGLTALLMCLFLLIDYVTGLFRLSGGTLAGLLSAGHLSRLIGGPFVLAVVFFLIWSYWQGENWSRFLVLIWSFLIAGEEVSTVLEQDGSLAAAMSHPIVFLKFSLAAFLLYWLNTRPLRAFFKNTPTAIDHLSHQLVGKLCTAIEIDPTGPAQAWHLAFEHDAELTLHCPWRIVLDDNLAFATSSGNPMPEVPVDEEQPRRLLQNLRVKAVRVTPHTSDLFISFEMGIELQTWSADPRSPQWNYSDPIFTVFADSVGLNSQMIAASVPTEDSADGD